MSDNDEGDFKVILTGSFKPDISLQEAEQRLSQLFNVAPEKVRPLLQGRPTTLKVSLSKERAEIYRQALTQAGIEFEIIEKSPKLSLVPCAEDLADTRSTKTPTPKLPACPKCGYRAKGADDPLLTKYNGIGECPKCGVIPKNYLEIQRERQNFTESPHQNNVGQLQQVILDHVVHQAFGSFNKIFILILILLLVFGSGLVINTLFFTRDHHVLYQLDTLGRGCFTLEDLHDESSPIIGRVLSEYKDQDWGAFFQSYGGKVCIRSYSIEIGNIGKRTVTDLGFRMDEDLFKSMFADGQPDLHIHFEVQNLNAADPRKGDPVLAQEEPPDIIAIKDLDPGAYMKVFFFALHAEGNAPGWKDLLRSTYIGQGDLDQGNPKATVLGRIFF